MPERPYTHTQYDDRSEDEKPCEPDRHHWVNDEEVAICTRCGTILDNDEPL